jgi:hypothetical protein
MRKIALLAAVVLSAAFTSPSFATTDAELYALNKNTHSFMKDLWNPYAATATPAGPTKKMAKKKK